jgi:hypothetical protein
MNIAPTILPEEIEDLASLLALASRGEATPSAARITTAFDSQRPQERRSR